MSSSTTYVVLATQLNRAQDKPILAGGTGGVLGEPITRGSRITAADVTAAELERWLTLKPRVLVTEKEYEELTQTATDARTRIAELEAELAEYRATAAATQDVAGQSIAGVPEQPAGNASRDAWATYAKVKASQPNGGTLPPEDDAFISDPANDRNALKARYGATA